MYYKHHAVKEGQPPLPTPHVSHCPGYLRQPIDKAASVVLTQIGDTCALDTHIAMALVEKGPHGQYAQCILRTQLLAQVNR